ncbi:hypothetical protein Tco_1500712 [Tanacetum coccineum]
MASSHNQSITDVGLQNCPLMLEKGSYVPWSTIAINTKFLNSLQSEWNKAKRAARTHDPLALVANHYVVSSSYHTSSPYYVTYPSSVADFDVEAQSYEFQGDASTDDPTYNLTTAMMLLAKAITQEYSTPMNNHLHASSNTHNQVYV